jgi:hypothetical protein
MAVSIRALVIIAVGGLAVAGCGDNNPATQEPATSTAPSTVITPGPATTTSPATTPHAPLTREQAARRYLAIIKSTNAVLDEPQCAQSEDFFINGGSWPPDDHPEWDEHAFKVLRACHKKLLPMQKTSFKAFQTTLWPVDARADMADLILQSQAFLRCLKKSARVASDSEMYKALECFTEDDGSADRVRARFGLPIRTPAG